MLDGRVSHGSGLWGLRITGLTGSPHCSSFFLVYLIIPYNGDYR